MVVKEGMGNGCGGWVGMFKKEWLWLYLVFVWFKKHSFNKLQLCSRVQVVTF